MRNLTRRGLLIGSGAAAGAIGTGYFAAGRDPRRPPFPARRDPGVGQGTILDDASGLNPTAIARHIVLTQDPRADFIARLRAELKEARDQGRSVVASAARHSMGAQSLAKDGLVVSLDQSWLEADSASGSYRVAAGVRWHTVLGELDAIGFSPAVMQSNNDFGVAGTFSVNAHGWPVPFGPFGSTVRSATVMLADGELLKCSRSRNPEIFSMAMGGYGLIGIVIELHMEMVPNVRLEPNFEVMPARDFGSNFLATATQGPAVRMAYGRMNVAIDGFIDEAVMVTYRQSEDQADLPRASRSAFLDAVSREILRGQVESEHMKDLRWTIETGIAPVITGGSVTRNGLLDEPVSALRDSDPGRTDILHEYFVAPTRFAEFLAACREIIPSSYQELLNVTLRYVGSDDDSVLAYAPQPRIAAVMLFSQERTVRAEADMARMTGALIEAVLGIGGTYYLPYRPHATVEQFAGGYPGLPEFVSRKRELDPRLVFRNGLWDRYMAAL